MLSIPAIVAITGTEPVLLHRHPGAMLVSYRRMGWAPDLDELRPIVRAFNEQVDSADRLPDPRQPGELPEAEEMGEFWNMLYGMALHDLAASPGTVVVAHEDLAMGGLEAATTLFDRLRLRVGPSTTDHLDGSGGRETTAESEDSGALHRFGRNSQDVASSWRGQLQPGEAERLEAMTTDVAQRLGAISLRF